MKKIISSIAALAIAATMSTGAFAANITAKNGTDQKSVSGTYVAGTSQTVYRMDVSWGSMQFTYTDASTGTWNPATHSYSGASAAAWSWEDNANLIQVTNHSNAAVKASLAFSSPISGLVGGFYNATKSGTSVGSTLSLASAAEGASLNNFDKAPTASAYLQLSGFGITESKTLGNITVTLK